MFTVLAIALGLIAGAAFYAGGRAFLNYRENKRIAAIPPRAIGHAYSGPLYSVRGREIR